jgi:alcohol dehydrogenase class IV
VTAWTPFEHCNPATRIVSGVGAADRLPELLDDLGIERALVVCGNTVSRGPQLALVEKVLGERLAGTFVGITAHAGLEGLRAGVDQVDVTRAEALISIGGGATIDSAKCIALLRAIDEPLDEYRVRKDPGFRSKPRRIPQTIPHLALPTTAGSSSEVMPWAGIRNEQTREKMLFRDPSLVPAVAVLDPRLVAPTEPWLTATSGVTALARGFETLYSSARQPIAEALALQSIRLLGPALPRAVEDGSDLDARAASQVGATISGIAADNSMVSLVHAVGHVVGGRIALQHGMAHAVLLPIAVRTYLPTTGSFQRQVAQAMGVDTTGLDDDDAGSCAADELERLLERLPLARRLRDVGVEEADLDDFADQTVIDPMFAFVPRTTSRDEVREMLQRAW